STVGLISIQIFEYKDIQTRDYAINLGIALQLTNILRDLKEDLLYDRIYLPLEDFRKFNYTEYEFKNQIMNNNYFQLMEFELARAQNYFEKTNSLLPQIDKKNLYPAIAMKNIYWKLLKKIQRNGYDVFKRRICITRLQKLAITFSSWFQSTFI
ncbi:MAG: squalene/phytoene synthase family protein, partial [Ignavibacteria bacterium]|nr:squalene/phytoene synthase family protein [Ignavibacteria bacterium]